MLSLGPLACFCVTNLFPYRPEFPSKVLMESDYPDFPDFLESLEFQKGSTQAFVGLAQKEVQMKSYHSGSKSESPKAVV